MIQELHPLDDRVLIRKKEAPGVTAGGIIVPERARELSDEAVVVAKGPGRRLEDGTRAPIPVEVGDTILIGKSAGYSVIINDEKLHMIKEMDMLVVLEDD